jgi:hypothetical protein
MGVKKSEERRLERLEKQKKKHASNPEAIRRLQGRIESLKKKDKKKKQPLKQDDN